MSDTERIQDIIGYRFSDKNLVAAAFTHSSYVNEHKGVSNERLEFLGDCVLNFLVGLDLFEKNKSCPEGKLSSLRASIVSRGPLARLVDSLGLMPYLRVGAGVDKSQFSDKARSDLFEALLGAIYLDGGLPACKTFLDKCYFPYVSPQNDPKSALQIFAGKHGLIPEYVTSEERNGNNLFVSTVKVGGAEYTGSGRTKHESQIDAARNALAALDRS